MIDMARVPGYGKTPPRPDQYGYPASPSYRPPAPPAPTPPATVTGRVQPGTSITRPPTTQPAPAPAPTAPAPTAPATSAQQVGFWTPQEWSQSGQYYQSQMPGAYTIPQSLQTAIGSATDLVRGGGLPTSATAWGEAYQPVLNRQIEEARKQAMETANLEGWGDSSVLGNQIFGQTMDLQNQFNMNLLDRQMGLDEASKQRMLAGMGLLGGFGGQEIGADQFGQQFGFQNAQALAGLGDRYFNAPFQLSQGYGNLGSMYNNNLVNPAMQQYNQMLMQGLQSGVPQTYTPGIGTQGANLFGLLGNALDYFAPTQSVGTTPVPTKQAINTNFAQPTFNPEDWAQPDWSIPMGWR